MFDPDCIYMLTIGSLQITRNNWENSRLNLCVLKTLHVHAICLSSTGYNPRAVASVLSPIPIYTFLP